MHHRSLTPPHVATQITLEISSFNVQCVHAIWRSRSPFKVLSGLKAWLPESQSRGHEERYSATSPKIPDDFLSIVPFGSAYLVSDLPAMDPPATETLDFTLRNVVIQQDHAAGFVPTSRTSPRRTSDTASETAVGLISPANSSETFCGVDPLRIISRAS